MIDELKIVQEIFGSLAGVGLWGIAAYFVYKLSFLGGIIWLIRFCVIYIMKFIASDYTTAQIDDITAKAKKEVAEKQAELERVLHMYKILKGDKKDV